MDLHFKKFSENIKNFIKLKRITKPLIVEIGSNDGIMLKRFKNMDHVGIEPSKNVADVCKKHKCNVINEFFNEATVKKFINLFIEKLMCFILLMSCVILRTSNLCLKIFLIPYLIMEFLFLKILYGRCNQKNSYDQIYDEHVYLFSVASIMKLAKISNLQLFDAKPQSTHGGSMRYYICKKHKYKQTSQLKKIITLEKKLKLDDISTYRNFANSVKKSKTDLIKLLKKIKKNGKSISAYGATSKSTTIFNYCNIKKNLIENYYDNTKIKQNKFSPGMHIPVKSFSKMKNYPDYFFLSAWNHKNEILNKEKKFKAKGGKWILHVPNIKIV